MRFTSLIFVVFFLCVYVLFWSRRRTRLPLLFVASFAFYAAWSIGFAVHFLAIISVSYLLIQRGHSASIAISNRGDPGMAGGGSQANPGSKVWLWAVLALNFTNLFCFKYAYAGALLLIDLGLLKTGVAHPEQSLRAAWPGFALVLPLAISFYTFQICAYAIDVSRGQVERDPGFLRFAVFILFFPQLVAGPIMRYHEFFGQLDRLQDLKPRLPEISSGIYLLIQGFTKKVLIADNLLPATTAVLFSPEQYDWQSNVAAIVGFAAQLYCDFSGYTDIARGLGKLLGLRLPENFFAPYLSTSFRVFWRNWHRTLTTWLRDYVYIPLGGNQSSGLRGAINTMVVLVLIGVWHGAGYNFFVLGLANGLYLIGEGMIGSVTGRSESLAARLIGTLTTLTFVCLAMVMMVTPDLSTTLAVYGRVFGLDGANQASIVSAVLQWLGIGDMVGAGAGVIDPQTGAVPVVRFAGISQLWGGFALALFFNVLQKIRDDMSARSEGRDPADWFFATGTRRNISLGGLWILGFLFLILLGRYAPGGADFFYFQF